MNATSAPPSSVVIQGVDRYRLWGPMFEGARLLLNYRGENYAPATVQGLSGSVFRLGGICPCAPTVAPAMAPHDLARLLGYQVEWLAPFGQGLTAAEAWPGILDRIKAELRAGRPVLVWHAFTMLEWDLVTGYDDAAAIFYGRGAYAGQDAYATAPQDRPASGEPALGAVVVGERLGAPVLAALEVASLQEAVRHAHSRENADCAPGDPWKMLFGLACWDRWVETFRRPDYVAGNGDHYCFGVYRATHALAAPYLREVAAHHPAAGEALTAAADEFARESAALDAAGGLFPGWGLPREADVALNARVADRLAEARDAYARGIDAIDRALAVLGPPPPAPYSADWPVRL